jgi:superfamily II DNA or RNA helicase
VPSVKPVVVDGEDKLEIVSTVASYILERIQGAVLVGATDEAPVVQVPWTQHAVQILTSLRAPYLPLMANAKYMYPWAGFDSPMPHQFRMTGFLASHNRGFCLADPGCVDGSTEYLSPTGWVAIKDYTGGQVLQYVPSTGTANFVEPLRYINEPAKTMLAFKTTRGLDMMLSGQHRMIYKDKYGTSGMHTVSALDIAANHWKRKSGFIGGIPTAFHIEGTKGIPLTDEQLREMIQLHSDLSNWWGATVDQLEVICDELTKNGNKITTLNRRSADFVQYAFAATNRHATISYTDEYTVTVSKQSPFISMRNSVGGPQKDSAIQVVDAPDNRQYCFEVPSSYLVLRRNGKIFCTGNTGKSATTVWAADFLMGIGTIKTALIVCPRSLMNVAWKAELNKICPARTVNILSGEKSKRAALVKQKADVDIINFDGVEVIYDELKTRNYDLVVVDESTAYKNESTARWTWLRALTKDTPFMWLLTGTPTPQSPEDAHGQIRLLYGDKWPVSKGKWKGLTMDQHGPFKWVAKKAASDIVRTHMQPAIYVSKREAMPDMPPIMLTQREVELSVQQKRLIKELKKDYMATVGTSGITAVHAAALRLKIVQIASGTVYDDLGEVVEVDNTSRDQELIDIVRQVRSREFNDGTPNNKLIVFCAFKHTVHRVVKYLIKNGIRAVALTGDNSARQRDEAINRLQMGTELEVLVAIPDIAAHGLTFTAASTTVWYSPVAKADFYIQANNRMDRPGQKQHMEITRIYACEAEKNMYNTLSDKLGAQADVLSGYAQLVESL